MKIIKNAITAFCSIATIALMTQTTNAAEMRQILTLDMAKKIANACEAEKDKNKDWRKINIAVVDSGGNLVLFRRQTGAFMGSIKIAIAKAKSSASIPVPTRTISTLVYGSNGKPGRVPGLVHAPDVVAFAGGLPIRNAKGHLLGAVGVSGATSDQDELCAKAGIAAIADELK